VLYYLSPPIAHSTPSFLSFHPIPVFSLLIPTSESRHHFPLFCTLSQVRRNFLCPPLLILPVISGFFDSLSSFLLACVFVPFTQVYVHPSSFCSQSFHFFTGITFLLVVFLFLLLLRVLFLFSPAFRHYPELFSSIHFVLKLCHSLSRFHSPLVPSIPKSLPSASYISIFSTMLSNIIILLLKSPPLFLFPIPHRHPTALFAFLILFTLPLSLVEHHHFRSNENLD
jgi:hypothetical protein